MHINTLVLILLRSMTFILDMNNLYSHPCVCTIKTTMFFLTSCQKHSADVIIYALSTMATRKMYLTIPIRDYMKLLKCYEVPGWGWLQLSLNTA